MTILLIANTKGGCGKSTLTCNMSVVLANSGRDCMIVDADRGQGSASEWWADRKTNYPTHPRIACVQKYMAIDSTLEDLDTRYEYTLVDVSGRESEEMNTAMEVCDVVLIPVKPGQFDLSALHTLSKIIHRNARVNPKIVAYAVLSIAPTNALGKEIEQAQEVLSGYPEIVLLKTIVRDRKVYRDSIAAGLGVIEVTERSDSIRSAQNEIKSLVAEVTHGL